MTGKYRQLLTTMGRSDNEAADQAIGLALLADDGWLTADLADALLERATTDAVSYVVRTYHKLDQSRRKRLLGRGPRTSGALRLAAGGSDPQARRNVIAIIIEGAHPSLVYLLIPLIHDEVPAVRAEAGAAIKVLAEKLRISLQDEPQCDDQEQSAGSDTSKAKEDLGRFCLAIELAFESFASHLRTEVVESAMYLATHLPETIWAKICEPRSRIGRAAGEILQRNSDTRFAGFAFRAFTDDELVRTAARVIASETNTAFMREWLDHARGCPATDWRKRLARIRELRWLAHDVRPLLESSPDQQLAFIDILTATSIPVRQKLNILGQMLTANDFAVQDQVVAALIDLDDLDDADVKYLLNRAASLGQVIDFSPQAAKSAERHLAILRRRQAVTANKSARSSAGEAPADGHFDDFWSSFDQLDESACQDTAKALDQEDGQFLNRIRAKLAEQSATDRLRAISLVRKMRLTRHMGQQIHRLCGDPDCGVRAMAVAALADIPGRETVHKLIEAIDDQDPRIQANAIEALEAVDPTHLQDLIEPKLASPNNRIRANAITAILKPEYTLAMQALVTMLGHPDATFRRSALWAISKAVPLHLLAKIRKLAECDPDSKVKQVAGKTMDELINYWRERKQQETQPAARGG